MLTDEVKILAKLITDTHGGKIFYDLGEVADIVGIHRNYIGNKLHMAGVTVRKMGKKKIINAYDIASFMCMGRIAPIDNISKGA